MNEQGKQQLVHKGKNSSEAATKSQQKIQQIIRLSIV